MVTSEYHEHHTCPRCDGKPRSIALVMRHGVCEEETVTCPVCEGMAFITMEHYARWVVGQSLRSYRIAARMPLSVAAQIQRIPGGVAMLSGIEHGTHWLSQAHAKRLLECWGMPEDCATIMVEAVGGTRWDAPEHPFITRLRQRLDAQREARQ